MRAIAILVMLLQCLPQVAATRQQSVSVAHYPDPQLVRPVEDRVAEQIMTIRQDAKLPKLKRIYGAPARQLACTAALQGKTSAALGAFFSFVMYVTDDQSSADSELQTIANLNYNQWPFAKFSVAAWPLSDPRHPPGTYGIAITLLPPRGSNWFARYVTDRHVFKEAWKQFVAPQCEDVR